MRNKVIIVLGHLLDDYGELGVETMARVELGIHLFNEFSASLLVTCGWAYKPGLGISLGRAMKMYARRRVLDSPGKIISQELSRDTVGDAVFSAMVVSSLVDLCMTEVHLVTSEYHLKRASEVFHLVYGAECSIKSHGSSTDFTSSMLSSSEEISLKRFRESFGKCTPGNIYQIFELLRYAHPFYNGQIHPQIGSYESVTQELVSLES